MAPSPEEISSILGILFSVGGPLEGLLTIFKVVGIAFVVYVIYLVISLIFKWKRYKQIQHIGLKMNVLEEKIDKLMKNKSFRKPKK